MEKKKQLIDLLQILIGEMKADINNENGNFDESMNKAFNAIFSYEQIIGFDGDKKFVDFNDFDRFIMLKHDGTTIFTFEQYKDCTYGFFLEIKDVGFSHCDATSVDRENVVSILGQFLDIFKNTIYTIKKSGDNGEFPYSEVCSSYNTLDGARKALKGYVDEFLEDNKEAKEGEVDETNLEWDDNFTNEHGDAEYVSFQICPNYLK